MSSSVSPLLSRLAALALLFVLGAGIWFAIVSPLVGRFASYRETVEVAEEQGARLQRLAAMTPRLRIQLARVRRDPSMRGQLLRGASDALAAATLQNRVKQVAGQNGLTLRSVQDLAPAQEDEFRRIGIRVAFEGDVAALDKVFHALETSATLLFLDNVQIRSRSGGRIARKPNRAAAPENLLSVRFDVFGYTGGTEP